MKRFMLSLFMSWSVVAGGYCEDDLDLPGYRATFPEQMLNMDYLSTTSQKNSRGSFSFSDANVSVNKIVSRKENSTFSLTGGIRRVSMQLGHHLRPEKTCYALLGSSLEYTGVEHWKWAVDFSIQPDVRWLDLLRTTRYINSLHGRYQQTKALGWHVGAYVESGMRVTSVQPIIGIDYTKGSWQYQALFPFKAGVSYIGLPHHLLSFMIRSLYTATKVREGFHHHPAVALYKATGVEIRWDLSPNPMWVFWASLGHTLTSSLRMGNRNFHHRRTLPLHQAPYAQIGINIAV